MKKIFSAIIFCSIFLAACVYAMDNPASGTTEKTAEPFDWDFGKIKEGEIIKREFTLKNEVLAKLKIKDITASCGCTTSKLQKSELAPGESTKVEITFNSKGFSGAVHKIVFIKTDFNDVFGALSIDGKRKKADEAAQNQVPPAPAQPADNSILKLIIIGEVIRTEPLPAPPAAPTAPPEVSVPESKP